MRSAVKRAEYYSAYRRFDTETRLVNKGGLKPERQKRPGLSAGEKAIMVFFIALAGAVCVGVILVTAYAASIQHGINMAAERTADIRDEIAELNIRLKRDASVEIVEQRALYELGMVYPSDGQLVYLREAEPPVREFAQYIKENAYRIW
ncbi:MAG: hypothetical protein LBT34_03785 [Clostridiales Family XIII bacterium]|jgi:cell division protein FtsL|nr:hypothetical protein [Clostridiales Family XIII bacterium]